MSTATALDVSRLLGRAAFGATATDLDTWTGRAYEDLVDFLLDADARTPLPDDAQRLVHQNNPNADADDVRLWWLERMRTTPFPLLERMTLLWHGHFATGRNEPPTLAQLLIQNQTLRANALGNVRTLLEAVNIDPAMLYWLNGVENAQPKSNENYAREFFELFTLGKRPQVYTETDIRQAARAFSGWYVDSTNTAKFSADRHNIASKKVLGRTITNQGDQEHKVLVDIALAQPVCALFFAYKLVANLAYVPASNDALVTAVADALTKNAWDIKAALRTLFLHDDFRVAAPAKERQLVRSPVECVVHAAKGLGVRITDKGLTTALVGMGHKLFEPVDVSGWPLGRDWVSPVTTLARYQAGMTLNTLATAAPNSTVSPLPASSDLAAWAKRLGLTGFTTNTGNAIGSYLRSAAAQTEAQKQAGVLTLLFSSPEWVVF